MIVEPARTQHPDIQRLGLDITKLEEATMESLSSFFSDAKDTRDAKNKGAWLKEIFKVARWEESYRRGEIGKKYPHFQPIDGCHH